MKKSILTAALLFLMASAFCQNSLPFTKGIDMLTYFEVWEPGQLPNLNKHTEADFASLKSMGVDVIRLPVHFDLLMEPYDTGIIYDFVLDKLDQVCDWAEKYQIYLVIDDHSFNTEEYDHNPPSVKVYQEHLKSVWSQIASRYCNRSKYIIYEIINEPKSHGEIYKKWIKLQQEIIDLIRTYDSERDIVVTSADFSSIDGLVKMKPYKDPNLIYTFHFYEPHIFTHQGATWVGKEMMDLEGLPFPYDRKRLPELKGNAKDSWVQWQIENEYQQTGTAKYLKSRMKKAADWAKKNNVRVWCGEIGAKTWINKEDRIAWIKATVEALNANNIPYCTWGIDGTDGFLTSDKTGLIFPDDIDKDVLEAYGFNMPDAKLAASAGLNVTPQKPYVVYDGILGLGAGKNIWGIAKETKDDSSHKYCLSVSYPGQWNGSRFSLPRKVTSTIAKSQQAYSVCFAVKFTAKNQEFKLYLRDSDEGEKGLPWRKSYTIKAADYSVGKWVSVEIPVSRFADIDGAFSEVTKQWHDLPCKFDWSRFEELYFDFDDPDNKLAGNIYIDDIMIKRK